MGITATGRAPKRREAARQAIGFVVGRGGFIGCGWLIGFGRFALRLGEG